jgi:hypothetical protein
MKTKITSELKNGLGFPQSRVEVAAAQEQTRILRQAITASVFVAILTWAMPSLTISVNTVPNAYIKDISFGQKAFGAIKSSENKATSY